jgi:hypothetical protein
MGLAHSPSIVTNGLVMCLDAANTKSYPGSGTTWTDLTGNGINGTLTNGPTFNSGNNGSIVFDGSNDYVTISPGAITNFGTGQFALEVWINLTVDNNARYIIDTRNSSQGANSWGFYFTAGRRLEWFTGSGAVYWTNNNPLWSIGSTGWQHFVVTRENTGTNGLKFYINSVLTSQATDTTNYSLSSTTSYIGCRFTLYETANGSFSIVKIYKGKSLTAEEVAQNFNALRGRFNI